MSCCEALDKCVVLMTREVWHVCPPEAQPHLTLTRQLEQPAGQVGGGVRLAADGATWTGNAVVV
jgi:hypothetical protein